VSEKITLTDQQQAAVAMVMSNKFSVITGKPGTGKTTVLVEVIARAEAAGKSITLAAPTGKAARRMQEATGMPAATIHSTLGCIFVNDEFQFIHNRENPLHTDLLIIDEASMITNSLMADLLAAVGRNTSAVFVGDQYQLPAIGPGAILRDLISSGLIPCVELDIIHRNAGSIVRACADIHSGREYAPDPEIDLGAEAPRNLIHVETMTPEQTADAIVKIMCDRMPLRGFDPGRDVQVLSPVNTRGELSCEALNLKIRARLNPEGHKRHGVAETESAFWPGDKVLNCVNKIYPCPVGSPEDECYVSNGDVGFVDMILPGTKKLQITFSDPDRTVLLPIKNNKLLHAWAMTVHKSQGGQFPVVIFPLHSSFQYFVNRPLLYTAVSRAKTICITVGQLDSMLRMVANNKAHYRLTRLKERMVDCVAQMEGI
jgi:exodeoxyribonuclease V alpha subunit